MNRIALLSLLAVCSFSAAAQGTISGITIGSNYKWAQFYVDGQLYTGTAQFLWPQGSVHVVQFLSSLNSVTAGCVSGSFATALQFSPDNGTLLAFSGWRDNNGKLIATSDPIQTVTADPGITSLTATLTVQYLVQLQFFNDATASPTNGLPNCIATGAPGTVVPGDLRPGVAMINGNSYWGSAILYLSGTQTLNAFPYPGFAFRGWSVNGNQVPAYLATVDIESPITLIPQFTPAKRVRFLTNPMGMDVLVDRSPVLTTPSLDLYSIPSCPSEYTRPPAPPPGIPALCFGDFDFAPYSTHVIGAPSPQTDIKGKVWVFTQFDRGGGENTVYTTDNNTGQMDVITAEFVPGAVMSFNTNPVGLPLTIDGQSTWPVNQPSITVTWAMGTTHQVSAAATATDKAGRKYTFQNWSNNGPASQTLTVDQNDVNNGGRMVANYSVLSRVTVQTAPAGLTIQVNGASCQTPCTVDQANGSTVHVTAPASIPNGAGSRLDFVSWSDSGAADHVYTISGDTQTIWANYQQMFLLSTSSNPAGGASFQASPSPSDMYFPVNQPVIVTANANAGFKFRRWGGDMSGTYPTGQVTMSQPMSAIALMDSVPYIAPAGIQNAAGVTPENAVAPGSIVAIFGVSLTPGQVIVGPTNPLAQTLGGVVVTVADRILPLLFVSPTQVNAQLPPDLPEGDYTLTISATGQPDVTGSFRVARNAPGLFTWGVDSRPFALALHQDGTPITPDKPAIQGETVTIYGTGFGPTQQPLLAGFLLSSGAPNPLVDNITIQLGDFQPAPAFAGASSLYIGMEIVQFQITSDLPSATTLDLTVTLNGQTGNTVQLPLQ